MRELGVFINETARPEYKKKGLDLVRKAGAQILNPTFPVNIPDDVETVIAIGGNGSIKGVIEGIFKKTHQLNLLVVPGGSQNGFYRSVRGVGAVITEEQLLDRSVSGTKEYNPPSVNGELFNHGAGFGENVAVFEHFDEQLRKSPIPRDLRSIIAALLAVSGSIKDSSNSEYILQIASPGSFLGRFRAFPDQEVFSDEITFAKVKGGTRRETLSCLTRIFWALARGNSIPEDLASLDKAEKFDFVVNRDLSIANIDGQIRRFEVGSKISISRGVKVVNVAAVSL